jgi:hypothetical protein
MKLAIMQPYFFPYLGYWQLIHAVDRFVIYDDVNYIKSGWINRNRILINGIATYITVPLYQSSSYKRICDTQLQTLINWSDKLLKKIDNTYKKAPYFTDTFPVIEKIILYKTDNLADFLANQLIELSKLMNLSTEIVLTSRIYGNQQLSGQERVIDICRQEQTDIYLNAIGGQTLYDSKTFSEAGIKLQFIEMKPVTYSQKSTEFVPYLSIIDVLMNIGVKGVKEHLNAFELKTN